SSLAVVYSCIDKLVRLIALSSTLFPPILNHGAACHIGVILRRNNDPQFFDRFHLIGSDHHSVLDGPALVHDGGVLIRLLISVQNDVNCPVTHGVYASTPAQLVHTPNHGSEFVGGNSLETEKRPLMRSDVWRILVPLSHQRRLKTAINPKFADAIQTQLCVSKSRVYTPF